MNKSHICVLLLLCITVSNGAAANPIQVINFDLNSAPAPFDVHNVAIGSDEYTRYWQPVQPTSGHVTYHFHFEHPIGFATIFTRTRRINTSEAQSSFMHLESSTDNQTWNRYYLLHQGIRNPFDQHYDISPLTTTNDIYIRARFEFTDPNAATYLRFLNTDNRYPGELVFELTVEQIVPEPAVVAIAGSVLPLLGIWRRRKR